MNIHGVGIGLRNPHIEQVLSLQPKIDWLEVHSENFFTNSIATKQLEQISKNYPLSFHGVGLSIGSADSLDFTHLQRLKTAISRFNPSFVSDHLSWSSVDNKHYHDLLPLSYTPHSLDSFCIKIKEVQDFLGRQILIENPSSYLQFESSTISEWDFFTKLPKKTGCGLLVDINNIFVSSKNHNFDAKHYIDSIDKNDVFEIHLAGHSVKNYKDKQILIDDHGSKVSPEVWELYDYAIAKFGKKPTLIEWDSNIPDLQILLNEAQKARNILDKYV